MSLPNETGHKKNEANFGKLIAKCLGFGALYKPSNKMLEIFFLTTMHMQAQGILDALKTSRRALATATNTRNAMSKPVKGLATRVINSLASTGASEKTVKDTRSIVNKLQGIRTGPEPTVEAQVPGGATAGDTGENTSISPKTISISQQSFDMMMDNLARLITLLLSEPLYQPNEADLRIDALQKLYDNLVEANNKVIEATTVYENDLIKRDKFFYSPKTGMVDVALDVKKYAISIFSANSPEYKMVRSLTFRNIERK